MALELLSLLWTFKNSAVCIKIMFDSGLHGISKSSIYRTCLFRILDKVSLGYASGQNISLPIMKDCLVAQYTSKKFTSN